MLAVIKDGVLWNRLSGVSDRLTSSLPAADEIKEL